MPQKIAAIPSGYHSATPFLCVRDAAGALAFYRKAFSAVELERHDEPGGKVSMVHVRIGDSPIMISDETSAHAREHAAEGWSRSPAALGGTSASIYLYVDDADSIFHRAVDAGARVIHPLMDAPWGDRIGSVKDPFGHLWSIATHKRDVPHDQHKSISDEAVRPLNCARAPDSQPELHISRHCSRSR